MANKTYRVQAPLGNAIVPKEVMTAEELRAFALQLVQDDDTWREKVAQDDIESVLEWLVQLGYEVKEV